MYTYLPKETWSVYLDLYVVRMVEFTYTNLESVCSTAIAII